MAKRAIFDCDGVVFDFTGALLDAVGSQLSREEVVEWDLLELLEPGLKEVALEVLTTPDFWGGLELLPGAHHGVGYAESEGYKIAWVTSPWEPCKDWKIIRRELLNTHFDIDKRGDEFHPRRDKEAIQGDLFIDDKPENVDTYQVAHPDSRVYLFDQPYNRSMKWPRRINWDSDLSEVFR